MVTRYNVPPPAKRDFPNAVVVQTEDTTLSIYNLVPQQDYEFTLKDTTVNIHTTGQVRMLNVPNIRNVRDMGGWPTVDGRHIKYGKLFRGTELNGNIYILDSLGKSILLDDLHIGAELDIRADYDSGEKTSVLGFIDEKAAGGNGVASYYYTNDSGQTTDQLVMYIYKYRFRMEFNFIVNNLRLGRNIYIHCVSGANRTGYLAMLLEGLLGVDYDGMVKDYELTTFFGRTETKAKIDPSIEYILSLEGETMQQKFRDYWLNVVKVKKADVDYFVSTMLEGKVEDGISDVGCGSVATKCFDLLGRRTTEKARGLKIVNGKLKY